MVRCSSCYSFGGSTYQPSLIVTRFRLLTTFPSASLAQTWALTFSASLTGWPGGTITTLVGLQPGSINASKEASSEGFVRLSVFKGLIFLLKDLVEGGLHKALTDAEERVHGGLS